MRRTPAIAAAVALAGVPWLLAQIDELRLLPLNDPAIAYGRTPPQNRVTALDAKLRSGAIKLKSTFAHGYLEAVLKALDVPVSSQLLVFSKTSFQAPKIGPRMPRAIYHNDDTMVGWVQGGDVVEIAAVDPRQGVEFYTISQGTSETPGISRRGECSQCHVGDATLGVPGLVVRSTHVDRSGALILDSSSYVTDHRSPLEHRWGGWYVTGLTGKQEHMGNQFVENPADADAMDLSDGTNITDLHHYFDTTNYLRPDSDIVSLMVLEHQTRMVNLITRLGWETRLAEENGQDLSRIDPYVEELVKYMLFVDETPLKSPIEGNSEYAKEFSALGPRDSQGRSLRDFDLKTRMFRYPCSFLIYSAQFDGLPEEALSRVYARLHAVLSGSEYPRMSADDRKAILEILQATKKGWS